MHKGIHTPTMQTHTKTGSMSKGKQTSMKNQGGSNKRSILTPNSSLVKKGRGKSMKY